LHASTSDAHPPTVDVGGWASEFNAVNLSRADGGMGEEEREEEQRAPVERSGKETRQDFQLYQYHQGWSHVSCLFGPYQGTGYIYIVWSHNVTRYIV
jgi:hypothetical protein